MTKYFATHGRGTLAFVQNDLKSIQSVEILDSSIEGKILFSTYLPVSTICSSLKTVERVFLSILFHKLQDNVQIQRHEVLSLVETSFSPSLFNSQEFSQIFSKPHRTEMETKKFSPVIKFRVNCKLTGRWKASDKSGQFRAHLKDQIINWISSFNPRFQLDEDEPDFEVICHLTDRALSAGVPISKKPLSNRSYIHHVGLRATICSMMLQTAFLDTSAEFTFILGRLFIDNHWLL